jgi:hypothetical protein
MGSFMRGPGVGLSGRFFVFPSSRLTGGCEGTFSV